MDEKHDDAKYKLHGGPNAGKNPPPDSLNPTSEGEPGHAVDALQEENTRLNGQRRDPEEVRETEQEHHSPTRPDGDLAV